MRQTNTALNIEILGVNQIGDSASNPFITLGRNLPWLQDTPEQNVWNRWQIVYRDVRILDSQNQVHAVYNLTANDLGRPENRAALKKLFLEAARGLDTDQDGLPDDWENRFLETLTAGPGDDSDQDGVDNYNEFAFGTHPKNALSFGSVRVIANRFSTQIPVSMSFRRRAGSWVGYEVQMSRDLREWLPVEPADVALQPPQSLYDGTGMMEMSFFPSSVGMAKGPGFFRVHLKPRP